MTAFIYSLVTSALATFELAEIGKLDLDKPSQIVGRPGVELAVVGDELIQYGNEPAILMQ